MMISKTLTSLALLTGAAIWGGATNAAMLTGSVGNDTIGIGQSTMVDISLDLAAGEVASVFEGRFDLIGLGTVADASLAPGGSSWSSSFGNITGNQAIVSLTSDNIGSNRLVGSMEVTGLSYGTFEVRLGDPTFASFDTQTAPFLEPVNILMTDGDLLASVRVVPLPATLPLFGSALVGLAFGATRRRSRNQIPPTHGNHLPR